MSIRGTRNQTGISMFADRLRHRCEGEMLLVSLDRQQLSIDREAVDAEARELVLDAYRSAKISVSDQQSKFNAALERFCKAYPHIARMVARYAVAHIITTDGL